ncbi:riboflavin synthase alpha chain [Lachnospiraceae bacterium XBB1006]|nr:riboflavin synthase alpha chain [Lachnospiraceae bacterium XBB1006]
MFTGIIEETGILTRKAMGRLQISAAKVLEGTQIGDSIAVNGVCLTVTGFIKNGFTADVMPQTLRVSGLSEVSLGERVNLERAMAANGRFGGHLVTGHIDGVGKVRNVQEEKNAVWIEVVPPKELLEGIVEKGSIAIDGVSLTVASVTRDSFFVSLIPHTRAETNMENWMVGRSVNLETDIIGKYIKKMVSSRETEGKITMNFLSEHGFV